MTKKFFVLCMILCFCTTVSGKQYKSLSCSKNGLAVYFFNGDLPISDNESFALDQIRSIVNKELSSLDAKSDVSVEDLNFSTPEALKLIYNKVKEIISEDSKTEDSFEKLKGFLFTTKSFCNKSPQLCKRIYSAIPGVLTASARFRYAQWLLWGFKVKRDIELGKKVLLITFGYGNDIFNSIYKLYPLETIFGDESYIKLVAQIQVGFSFIPSSFPQKNIYTISEPGNVWDLGSILSSTYLLENRLNFPDLFNNSLEDTYISPFVTLSRVNKIPGRTSTASAEVMFREALEETAWLLANNDPSCCDGRDGRFFRANFEEPSSTVFAEDTVNFAKDMTLELSGSTQICGNVDIGNEGGQDLIKIENTKIDAVEGAALIEGDVYIFDSEFHASNPDLHMILQGEMYEDVPLYLERVKLYGSPRIEGTGIFSDLNVFNETYIQGSPFFAEQDQSWHSPSIINSRVDGGEITGFYSIEGRFLYKTNVTGFGSNIENFHFTLTHILPGTDIKNSNITGLTYLNGSLEDNVTIDGHQVGDNHEGLYLDSSIIRQGSEIHGSVGMVNGSDYSGKWDGIRLDSAGNFGVLNSSKLDGTYVFGAPTITASTIVDGFVKSTVGGDPVIESSKLYQPNVLCNAHIVGEETQGVTYNCGYNSDPKATLINMSELKEKRRIQTQKFLEDNSARMRDIRERFLRNI